MTNYEVEKDQKLINQIIFFSSSSSASKCTRCTTNKKELFRRFKRIYIQIQRPAFITTRCTYRTEL